MGGHFTSLPARAGPYDDTTTEDDDPTVALDDQASGAWPRTSGKAVFASRSPRTGDNPLLGLTAHGAQRPRLCGLQWQPPKLWAACWHATCTPAHARTNSPTLMLRLSHSTDSTRKYDFELPSITKELQQELQ